MKNWKTLFFIAAVIGLVVLESCGGGDEPLTKTDEVKQLLIGSGNNKLWKIQSATVDGADKGSLFANMTIKFSDAGFTSTNGGTVWPASGSWSFVSDAGTAIKRNDGTEVQVQVTETSLKLTLTWSKTTFGLGRSQSISGQHVFSFGL